MKRAIQRNAIWCVCVILAMILAGAVALAKDAPPEKAGAAKETAAKSVGKEASADKKLSAENKEHTYFDEFIDKFDQGGWTMWFLLGLSVAGIGRIIERIMNLRAHTFASPGLVDQVNELYQDGKFDELEQVCREDKSILGRIVLAIVDHRECEPNDIQSMADDLGSRQVRVQIQKAYMLAIIATLSPLLGLFGTVIGMIGAFDIVSTIGEMGGASAMAGSISKALVTTAGGLLVAMPMLGCYHWFRSRTNQYAIGLEEDVSELFSSWFLKKKKAQ